MPIAHVQFTCKRMFPSLLAMVAFKVFTGNCDFLDVKHQV